MLQTKRQREHEGGSAQCAGRRLLQAKQNVTTYRLVTHQWPMLFGKFLGMEALFITG